MGRAAVQQENQVAALRVKLVELHPKHVEDERVGVL
jgi:hypothetical protein